jgi:hypothetical protein
VERVKGLHGTHWLVEHVRVHEASPRFSGFTAPRPLGLQSLCKGRWDFGFGPASRADSKIALSTFSNRVNQPCDA